MPDYEVIVGNIGTVYTGHSRARAMTHYRQYVALSKADYGRVARESVTLFADGEIEYEYVACAPSWEPEVNNA